MRIELEEPYKSVYKPFGTVSILKNGRRIIYFTKLDGTQTGTSYARYLLSVKLGYFISDEYQVDHIDNNRTNDDVDNLQPLKYIDNIKKYHKYYKENIQKTYELKCKQCFKNYIVNQQTYTSTLNNKNTYCSKDCLHLSQTLSSDLISKINELAIKGETNESISRILLIDSTTVAKHRNTPLTNGTGINLSEEIINQIKILSTTGNSDLSIANKLGISATAVSNYRIIPSSTNRGRKTNEDIIKRIKNLNFENKSKIEISKELGISVSTVNKYI